MEGFCRKLRDKAAVVQGSSILSSCTGHVSTSFLQTYAFFEKQPGTEKAEKGSAHCKPSCLYTVENY